MKEKSFKLIALQQVILIILMSIISLMTVAQTAVADKQDDKEKFQRILETCEGFSTQRGEVKIYLDKSIDSAVLNSKAPGNNMIEIDSGVDFYVLPANGKFVEYNVQFFDSLESYYGTKSSNLETTEIPYDYVKQFKIMEDGEVDQLFALQFKNNEGKSKCGGSLNVRVYINQIKVKESPNRDYVVVGDTIYARQGAEICFGTLWEETRANTDKKATINGTFNMRIAENQYPTTNTSGKLTNTVRENSSSTVQVTWSNQFGTKATKSYKIVTSNLCNGLCDVVNGVSEDKTGMYEGYSTVKEIGAKIGQDTYVVIKGQPMAGKNMLSVGTPQIEINDKTGCLNSYNVNGSTIQLNAKKEGVIEVGVLNYFGVYVHRYWHIVPSDATEVNNGEKPSAPSTGNVGGTSGDTTPQKPAPTKPEINLTSVNIDKNPGNISVKTSNCTSVEYAFVPETKYYAGNYENEKRTSASNPQSFNISINQDSFEDGNYFIVFWAKNGNDEKRTARGPYTLGPKSVLKTPSITGLSTIQNTEASATTTFNVSNCTNLKYKVIKREEPGTEYTFNSSMTYDKFDGKEITNPKNVEINTLATVNGSGYYDIAIWGYNKDKSVQYKTVYGSIKVVNTPVITLGSIPSKLSDNKKEFYLNINGFTDKIKCTYYLHHKAGASNYQQPRVVTLKGENPAKAPDIWGQYTGGNIAISTEEVEGAIQVIPGYYDLTIYAENEYGKYRIEHIENIQIASAPKIEYAIEGENEEARASIRTKSSQTVNVKVTDTDEDEKITVKYFQSTVDYTQNGTKAMTKDLFENSENEVQTANNVVSGATINVLVTPVEGRDVNKYVYVMATDKYGVSSFLRTGTIRVDDRALNLWAISANKAVDPDGKVGYALGDKLEVTFGFTRQMAESYPDVYIKVGNREIKQDSAKVKNFQIIYTYTITEDFGNGDLSIGRMDYSNNNFVSADDTTKVCNKQISEIDNISDFIDGNYYVDTVAPQAESVEFVIDVSGEDIKTSNGKLYVSCTRSIKAVVTYNENVIGTSAPIYFLFGNKKYFIKEGDAEELRTTEEYDITEQVKNIMEENKYGGDIKANKVVLTGGINATDKAGNEVIWPQEVLGNATYKVIDTEANRVISNNPTQVIIDESIYDAELYVGDNRVEGSGTFSSGTTFTCFAEYKNSIGSFDDDVLYKADLSIISMKGAVDVYDKNNNRLTPTMNGQTAKYTLDENQLPVKFTFEETGLYRIDTLKMDKMGNETESARLIEIKDDVKIDKELSGMSAKRGETEYYRNIFRATQEEKEYSLALRLNGVSAENIIVEVQGNKTGTQVVELSEMKKDASNKDYALYKFNIEIGGKYNVRVSDTNDNVLVEDVIMIGKAYRPGDLNFDGTIDSTDLVYLLKHLAGQEEYNTAEIRTAGDVDGLEDSQGFKVTLADAVMLAKVIAQVPGVKMNENGFYYIDAE